MAIFKVITAQADWEYQHFGEKRFHDENCYTDVLTYCLNPDKLVGAGFYGVGRVDPGRDMKLLTYAYGKENGLHLRHWIISLSIDELLSLDAGDWKHMDSIARYAANFYCHTYQLVYAIHYSATNPHIHFVMNTTSYVDGRKYPGTKKDYYDYQNYLKDFLKCGYGLTLIVQKDVGDWR